MIPHVFGARDPGSVGIEEELFVVDPGTLEPAPAPAAALDGKSFKGELFATVLELNTGVCASAAAAGEELAGLRAEAKRRAAAAGLALAAAGTWPPAVAEEQPITADEGYRRFVEHAGSSARRQYCNGLHVHVGMASPEACLRALEGVLPWLPLVLALSANSPFVGGRESGLASARAEILALLPRTGAPPVFASYADWEAFAERLLALGLADDYTRIWWDVRPHPRFGTLEVRMPDQPTRLETSAALAELIQALVVHCAEGDGRPADRGLYAENRWTALRFGARARLIHPDGPRLCPVDDLLEELLGRLDREDLRPRLAGLAQADEQLRIGRERGLRELCEQLVALT